MSIAPKLSVIITAHHEGLLAHKTMLSIFRSLKHVEKARLPYEIIVHIDNGDRPTLDYYNRYKSDPRFAIYQNHFGDPALSRNFAAQKAQGEYLSFVDSDDLVSENWYLDGIKALDAASDKNLLVHANVNLTFGVDVKEPVIQFNEPSADRAMNAMTMLGENNWHSFVMGPKEIFEQFPYPETKNGYGHEDYTFNTNTLAAGIAHGVIKNSILFYRQKSDSVSISNNSSNAIQPYSELFDFDFFKNLSSAELAKPKKRPLYRAYKAIRGNDFLNYFITPVARATKTVIEKSKKAPGLPKCSQDLSFVIDEWKKINVIENLLYPTKERLRNLKEYTPKVYLPVASAYAELAKQITKKPDYVFIVPWVIRGGADKVLLNYLKAFQELRPDWHVAVITTLKADHAWQDRLAANADLIDFGTVADSLYDLEKEKLFSRLLTQLQCKNLHIINSEYGYLWSLRHPELLAKNYHLRVSLFSRFTESYNDNYGIFNYATYASELDSAIEKIFTDNQNVIDVLEKYEGFSRDKFIVQYQPVGLEPRPLVQPKRDGKLRILWASRVSEEKRPELLKAIAEKLDPEKYHIDVFGSLEPRYRSNFFELETITYRGEYNGAETLPVSDYDIFLYTSGIDGMPNIVLEMAALGLPIITSDAGGVKEFVKHEKTGLYVKGDNPDDFIAALKFAKQHPDQMLEFAANAQKLLAKQHSWDSYVKSVQAGL